MQSKSLIIAKNINMNTNDKSKPIKKKEDEKQDKQEDKEYISNIFSKNDYIKLFNKYLNTLDKKEFSKVNRKINLVYKKSSKVIDQSFGRFIGAQKILQLFNIFENIRSLDLSYTHIMDISFLSNKNMHNFKEIFLGWNPGLIDYTPLSNLTKLNTLFVHRNNIRDISFLNNKNFKTLRILRLNGNPKIYDYSPLLELTNLRSLSLSSNNLKDITFIKLKIFKNLKEIFLYDNPIDLVKCSSILDELKRKLQNNFFL